MFGKESLPMQASISRSLIGGQWSLSEKTGLSSGLRRNFAPEFGRNDTARTTAPHRACWPANSALIRGRQTSARAIRCGGTAPRRVFTEPGVGGLLLTGVISRSDNSPGMWNGDGPRHPNRIRQVGISQSLPRSLVKEAKQEGGFMGSPQSDQEFHCPKCGAALAVGADHCWKCRRVFLRTGADAGSPAQPASSEENADTFFSLKILGIVLVTLVAASVAFFGTCSGIAFAARGGLDNIVAAFIFGGLAAGVVIALGFAWLRSFFSRKKRRARQ